MPTKYWKRLWRIRIIKYWTYSNKTAPWNRGRLSDILVFCLVSTSNYLISLWKHQIIWCEKHFWRIVYWNNYYIDEKIKEDKIEVYEFLCLSAGFQKKNTIFSARSLNKRKTICQKQLIQNDFFIDIFNNECLYLLILMQIIIFAYFFTDIYLKILPYRRKLQQQKNRILILGFSICRKSIFLQKAADKKSVLLKNSW